MVSVRLRDRNAVFLHIPKTGGASISRVLRDKDDAILHPVKNMGRAVSCAAQMEAQLPDPLSAFDVVTCIRNPWDWTVSGWLHVTTNMPAYKSPPSFRDFVLGNWRGATILQYPEKFTTPEGYVAYHTQITQWEHLCVDGEAVDLHEICRFEHLTEDFARIFGTNEELPHINRSERVHYADYYDEETQRLVAARNQELIDRFCYTFN